MFRAVVQLKAVVQQNRIETRQQNRNALKQKCGVPVVFRHAQNSPTEVGQELAGITVHGAKRLHSNRLEDVLVFHQCAVFRDLAGGGQLGNSTGGGGCRLQVGGIIILLFDVFLRGPCRRNVWCGKTRKDIE